MTYRKSSKRILRELLAESGGKVSGRDATRHEVVLFLAIKDALDPAIPAIDRHRAVNLILDRMDGKALQPIRQSGTVQHTFTGRRLADIPDEEWPAIEDGLATKRLILQGNEVIINAEFEEITEPKSGESEA